MTTQAALKKMKNFWVTTGGSDYLEVLLELRKETPINHKSSEALDVELNAVSKAHRQFTLWTGTKLAKAKLNKKNA